MNTNVKEKAIHINISSVSGDLKQNIIIFGVLFIIIAVFTIINPTFLTFDNIHSILLTSVPVALIAIGECICIIGGNFDMSVGVVSSLAGLAAASLMEIEQPVMIAILMGVAIGLISGIIAGMSVSRLNMNAFITTFSLLYIYRGIIFIITEGIPKNLMGPKYAPFTMIGQTKLFGNSIQMPILIMVGIYILMSLFMKYTRLGRSIYLVGLNKRAAHICGIHVKNVELSMFIIVGVLSAIAGMLLASRTATSQPFVGELFAMEAIAATIVGGTSMRGGKGSIGMTFVGVLIVYIIKNGLIMVGLPDFYQYIAVGLILLLAVLAQTPRTKA